jgi:hypothetical protein
MTDEEDEIRLPDLQIDVVQCARTVRIGQRYTAKFDHVLSTSHLEEEFFRTSFLHTCEE